VKVVKIITIPIVIGSGHFDCDRAHVQSVFLTRMTLKLEPANPQAYSYCAAGASMDNKLLKAIGLIAIGYLLFRVVEILLDETATSLRRIARWIRWDVAPTLVGLGIALVVGWLVWQVLFSKE